MIIEYSGNKLEFLGWADRNLPIQINGKSVGTLKKYKMYGAICSNLETGETLIIPFANKKAIRELEIVEYSSQNNFRII